MPKKKATTIKKQVTITSRSKAPRKRKQRKGKNSGGKGLGLSMGSCTYKYARSLANPFEFSSCIPDGSVGTGVFSVKQVYTLGTGVGGSCCGLCVGMMPEAGIIVDTGSTQATPLIASTWTPVAGITTIAGLYAKTRPVSCGIRASYVGNTQTDQGVIVMAQYSGGNPPGSKLASQPLNGLGTSAMYYNAYPLRSGGQIIWVPDDMMDCAEFYQFATTGLSNSTVLRTPYLVLYAYGANANTAAVLQVEVIWNYEGQFGNSGILAGGISQEALAPAETGWYDRAKNALSTVDSIIPVMAGSNVGRAVGNAVIGYLGNMANGYASPGGVSSRMPRLTY